MKKIEHKNLIVIQKIGSRIEAGFELSECRKLTGKELLQVAAQLGRICGFFEKMVEAKKKSQKD